MNKEDQIKKTTLPPAAQIDFSKSITLTGVTEIISSTDKTFIARTGESVVTVQGEQLSPKLIDVEKNTAILGGKIYAVSLSKQLTPKGFFSKLFR